MEIGHKQDWEVFKAELGERLTEKQYKLLCKLHAHYYKHKYTEPCSCNPKRLLQWIADIDKVYNENNH